jgi:hypothetical protein
MTKPNDALRRKVLFDAVFLPSPSALSSNFTSNLCGEFLRQQVIDFLLMFLKSTESGPTTGHPIAKLTIISHQSQLTADKARLQVDDFSARNLNQGRLIPNWSLGLSSIFSINLSRNLPKN